jgi:hypothetical protein
LFGGNRGTQVGHRYIRQDLKLKIQTETNDEMKRWKQKQEQSIKQV